MATHLAHKIPWDALCELYVERHDASRRCDGTSAQKKKLAHVARVFAQTLREFKATAKPTPPEELAVLDPRTWGINDWSMGGYTGFYDSLLWGYVELNLVLADPTRMAPLLRNDRGEGTFIMAVLLGDHDGGHPAAIADKLAPAFDDGRLKPLTADVMQSLRDHAALLFRCMYVMTGDNKLLDDDATMQRLSVYFQCSYIPRD